MEEIFNFLRSNAIPCGISSISFGLWLVEIKEIPGTTTTIQLSRKGVYARGFENPKQVIDYISSFPEFQ